MPFNRHLIAALAALCLLAAPLPSRALDYPTSVVRLVIPYQPGGSAEAQARLLANELQKQWGKPVIIENKPGAGTTIGAAYVATQKPDGHTLYLASTSHTVTPSLYKSLPYDALKSFEQISMVSVSPFQAPGEGRFQRQHACRSGGAGEVEARHHELGLLRRGRRSRTCRASCS